MFVQRESVLKAPGFTLQRTLSMRVAKNTHEDGRTAEMVRIEGWTIQCRIRSRIVAVLLFLFEIYFDRSKSVVELFTTRMLLGEKREN